MKKVKSCYEQEVKRVAEKVSEHKGDFLFSLVADSHLDNSLPDTLANINAVDKAVNFDCLIHLGDFLNGNIPKNYTKEILKSQMSQFRESINNKPFYPAQGNHDGYFDLLTATDMAIDEDWAEAIGFVDGYDNVSHPEGKPYFYVDYPEKHIRFVIICSFCYTGFYEGTGFCKRYGLDERQIEWLREEAFNIGTEWSVMLFSHDTPFSCFDEAELFENNVRVNGNLTFKTLLECQKEHGFDVPAWFVGHFHGEYINSFFGINFVLIGSETAYVPQLWDMPEGGFYCERELDTETEDLWDSVVLDKAERKVRLIRFGAGEDREISY